MKLFLTRHILIVLMAFWGLLESVPLYAFPSLKKAEEIPLLSPSTLDQFIEIAVSSTSKTDEQIREAIHNAEKDSLLVDGLIARFKNVRSQDLGRGLVILSILGELGSEQAIYFYRDILKDEKEVEEHLTGEYMSDRDILEMYQTKVIQSLAYIKSELSDSLVLDYIRWHPAIAVRAAAIEAYMYNHGDSDEAKSILKNVLDEDDYVYLDRTRRNKRQSSVEFNKELVMFYDDHPEQIPPQRYKPIKLVHTDFGGIRSFFILTAIFIVIFLIFRKMHLQEKFFHKTK